MSDRATTPSQEPREELDSGVATEGGPTHAVPNDDTPWSVADVLAEMMAGVYSHGARVDVFEYRLYLMGDGGELPNVWTIHPSDGGGAIDALNLGAFRTASEIEAYLLEGE